MRRRLAASFVAFLVSTSAWAQATSDSGKNAQGNDPDAQQAAADAKANAEAEGDGAKAKADQTAQDAKAKVDQTARDAKAKTDQETKKAGNDVKEAGQEMKTVGQDVNRASKDLPAAGDNSPATPQNVQPWSAVSAQTMGEGQNLVQAEIGFPGVTATYLHGLSSNFDVGAKVGFLYGAESADTNVGFRAQAAMRWLLYSHENVKMGIEVDPGLYQTFVGAVAGGIVLPVKYTVAFAITDSLFLHGGVDVPLMLGFGYRGTGFSAPILFGGGAEYFISDSISITARLRIGPSFDAGAYFLDQDLYGAKGQVVRLGFDATVGASFRL